MNEISATFWISLAMVVVQTVLCHVLLERVKRENITAFEKMGAFHIFWNNTPRSTWLLWKWIFSSEPNNFSVGTRNLVWIDRLLTVVVLCWFLVQGGAIFWN